MEPFKHDTDFLNNDLFVEWRLTRTDELDRYWTQYAEKYPESQEALNEAVRKFEAVRLNNYSLSGPVKKMLFKRITDNVRRRRSRIRMIRYWSAAACIAVLAVSLHVFLLPDEVVTPAVGEVTDAFVGKVLPSDEIQLVSGNKVVQLNHNVQVVLKDDGQVSVVEEAGTTDLELADEMNKLIVPSGRRTTLHLADGTKVWLNSGSEFEFPSSFTSSVREVSVVGEMYIEVARDDKPFYVNTPRFRLHVLGTKFNVSAYAGHSEQSVVLVEGAVEVDVDKNATRLVPGELLAVGPHEMKKIKVNTLEYTSWKDGLLIFNRTSISEVLHKIGRYYNVDFKDPGDASLSAKTCTGKLLLSDNFDEVMISLAELSSTVYSKEDNIVYIKSQ